MTISATAPTSGKVSLGSKASFVPYLAAALGYFEDEGLEVDLLDKPAIKAAQARGDELAVQVNWFQHTVFGAAAAKPQKAVAVLNDAPGVTVMVANRVADEVASAADFGGRRIAEGASHSAKGILTNYLAHMAGVPEGSYTPVLAAVEGRREAVVQGLHDGSVDILTFMEPMTTHVRETGMVSTLYDLGTRESTESILGAVWPAECLLASPEFIEEYPETVQGLVNALVRCVTFIQSSTIDEVAPKVPDHLEGTVRHRWPTFVQEDFRVSRASAELVIAAIKVAPFDDSVSGQARARTKQMTIDPDGLFTNQFSAATVGPAS